MKSLSENRLTLPSHPSAAAFDELIARQLEQRRRDHLLRQRYVLETPQCVRPRIDGKQYLAFCSNDYLGLASHPKIVETFCQAAAQYGVGAGASHLITGHSRVHSMLEEELADFTGRERAVLFSTGYMANLGVTAALVGRSDSVFEDRLNHASLVDGGILSRARLRRYRHADPGSLAEMLGKQNTGQKLVLTDGVFSMDGDLAPLPGLASISQRHGAWLLVDDAHGLGVMGANGRGTVEHYGLAADAVQVLVGTLGKAFGTFGAFVAGSQPLVELVVQRARSYIYTTALPPAVAEATRASLQIIIAEPDRRRHLAALVARFRREAKMLRLPVSDSVSPIQPLLLGDPEAALKASAALRRRGIFVTAIRPPTVPRGSARLRITFSAAHTMADLERLLESLAEVLK